MKSLKWIGIALAAVLLVVGLLLGWALGTESGARFVLARVQSALDGKLQVERSSGRLSGLLQLHGVHYSDADAGIDARIKDIDVQLALSALLAKRVHIRQLAIDGVEVALNTPAKPSPPSDQPFSLQAPIDIVVDRVALQNARILQNDALVFQADKLDLAGAWTGAGMVIDSLALLSPDGEVSLKGRLATAKGYAGDGKAEFRWRVGDIEYSGVLDAQSDGARSELNVALNEPMPASLLATIGQSEALPWTLQLDAPEFALARVVPDSSIERVALNLHGSGDRHGGDLQGTLGADGYHVQVQPLKWSLTDDQLHIENLTLQSSEIAGQLKLQGDVALNEEPLSAQLDLNWEGVELPAELVGQALASHGQLSLTGNLEAFSAEGALALGPPGDLSDIRVKLAGTPQAIALESLALVQSKGGLDAHGTLTLQPAFAWQLNARGDKFDPGAFAADWPGALDFDLASVGVLGERGAHFTLTLDQLNGNLRGRAMSGQGKLTFEPEYVLNGELAIKAGPDSLRVAGLGGQHTDARAEVEIAALDHWLDGAQGQLRGKFHLHGTWPKLDLDADASASDVVYAGTRISRADLVAAITNIEQPKGRLSLKTGAVSQGDNRYEAISLEASGTRAAHEIALHAQGVPADLDLSVSGSSKGDSWDGRLTALGIAPSDARLPEFKLSQPGALSWDGKQFSLGDSCLVGSTRSRRGGRSRSGEATTATASAKAAPADNEPARRTTLCVGGEVTGDGALAARYRIDALPLRLLLGLAAPDSPVRLRGQIDGSGDIRRSASGVLSGEAHLVSAEGSALHEDNNDALMSYTDFRVDAELGASSQVTLSAALDHDGRLQGQLSLSGPEQALDGSLQLSLPDLSFVELLSPSIANSRGRLDAQYRIGGTLADPQLNGELTLKEFAAELPDMGLRLHDGNIQLRGVEGQRFILDGSIVSGDGTVTLHGEGGLNADAPITLTIKGSNVLAVEIPAARVLVSPDLLIERDVDKGILVTGTVGVPKGNVDLTKLPGGGARSASPDVVVVDDARVEVGKPMPFNARITLDLGDDVKLAGFGFDGKLSGRLAVNERPGRATTGTGTLAATGTYKAYGQDLTIESGRILFTGTAIDNPGLSIRAVREIKANNVTAGLMVRGTAQMPVLTVFSDPVMEQSNALSYLVTGKPLSALKSGEGDMLGTAARALGTAGGDLLAKSIGGRLGVDDIGVADNSTLGGAAFTVGKYLSPKLYLSYGVGIFDPGEVVTLRYLFSTRWNFEAQNATTGSRAGLNYRYEKE